MMRKNAHTLFNNNRFKAGFVYAEVYAFKVTSLKRGFCTLVHSLSSHCLRIVSIAMDIID